MLCHDDGRCHRSTCKGSLHRSSAACNSVHGHAEKIACISAASMPNRACEGHGMWSILPFGQAFFSSVMIAMMTRITADARYSCIAAFVI